MFSSIIQYPITFHYVIWATLQFDLKKTDDQSNSCESVAKDCTSELKLLDEIYYLS